MSGADPVAVHLHAVLEYSETLRELLAESGEQLEECRETAAMGDLDSAFKQVLQGQSQVLAFKGEYLQATQEVMRGASDEHISQWSARLARQAQTTPRIRWSRNSEYQEFRERLWTVNHPEEDAVLPALADEDEARGRSRDNGDDDSDNDNDNDNDNNEEDLVVAAARRSLICPLTQTLFKDPVKNAACGHSYSREAIIATARGAGQIPCPLSGCLHHVSIKSLVRDEALSRRIARRSQPRIFE